MLYVNVNDEKKVRGRLLTRFNDDTSEINFLKRKDLFMEFLTSKEALVCHGNVIKEFKESEANEKGRYITYNNKKYLLIGTKYSVLTYDVYEVLPDVYNDEVLEWKKNKKHGTLEARFELGMFEYLCTYRDSGTALIDVRYVKCENPHRNRVTIETIEVRNATNERIFNAISEWKNQMIGLLK